MTGFGELVRIRTGPGVDDDGNPVAGGGSPVEAHGIVEPTSSSEPTDRGRTGAVTGYTVYVSDPPTMDRYAEIEIRGKWCAVTGEPATWTDPDGADLGGVVITASRAEG